jgi:hypothetical protein
MLSLFAWQLVMAPGQNFFGDKAALIDIWFIGHFVYGVILAGCWRALMREVPGRPWFASDWFLLVMASICIWEAIELPMELGYLGDGARRWMAGVEPPLNRYLIDPIVAVAGALICRRYPKIWLPTFVFGLIFEAAHIASPTAMSIQEWLLAALFTP